MRLGYDLEELSVLKFETLTFQSSLTYMYNTYTCGQRKRSLLPWEMFEIEFQIIDSFQNTWLNELLEISIWNFFLLIWLQVWWNRQCYQLYLFIWNMANIEKNLSHRFQFISICGNSQSWSHFQVSIIFQFLITYLECFAVISDIFSSRAIFIPN